MVVPAWRPSLERFHIRKNRLLRIRCWRNTRRARGAADFATCLVARNRDFVDLATLKSMRAILACMLCLVSGISATVAEAQTLPGWQTYINAAAAYGFDYPAGGVIQETRAATLAYTLVHVQFPDTDTPANQGASVLVIEDTARAGARAVVAQRYREQGLTAPQLVSSLVIGAREARETITLARDAVVGDLDARTVLITGNGVVYRINLFGGGVSGEAAPSPQSGQMFGRRVRSLRLWQ